MLEKCKPLGTFFPKKRACPLGKTPKSSKETPILLEIVTASLEKHRCTVIK
jgi:hypothetical protein